MVFDSTPLTDRVRAAAAEHWGVSPREARRLFGGEESSAFRLGERVVRVGPAWRSDAELEWAHGVAAAAAAKLPEAIAPLPARSGATVVRVDGRPVSMWPFRAGAWPGKREAADQAAALLARLHRALRDVRLPRRPGPGAALDPTPDLEDAALDRWLAGFERRFEARQPLHGDFYAGNTLVESGRLVALLDWDDAIVGPPARELAFAAWEWGDGLDSLDLTKAMEFMVAYADAGGVAQPIDETALRQLVRERLRREIGYARAARRRGACDGPEDLDYEARQLEAFAVLGS